MNEVRSQATPAVSVRDRMTRIARTLLVTRQYHSPSMAMLGLIDALADDGWSKPRTVNSAAELDALPIGSAVAVALYPQKWHHGIWVKTDTDEWSSHDWRAKRDNESMAVGPEGAIAPATVLFTPGDAG